jgi:hypothetical protein
MGLPISIDSIKSSINRHGGVARGNRFAVYISHPSKSINNLLRFDPATFLNNAISGEGHHIGDFINDPRDMFLLCKGLTLPGKRISTTEAAHNHNLSKKPYSAVADEVTMTFMLTNDYYIKKYFDLWQEMIIDTTGQHYKTMYKKDYVTDVTIQQLSNSNHIIPGYTLMLENAYPIQVGTVELGNESDGMLELSITWEYDNFRRLNNFDVDLDIKLTITDDGMLKELNKHNRDRKRLEPSVATETKNNPFLAKRRQIHADGTLSGF